MSRAHGFSLIEIAVVTIIFAVLAGALLQRLFDYQSRAELAQVARTTALLRSALVLKAAQLQVKEQGADMAALAGTNPMDLLAEKPHNYIGEFFSPPLQDLEQGSWLFDRKCKCLIYLLNHGKTFPYGTMNSLKFKVKLINPAQETPGLPSPEVVKSVSLVQENA